MAAPTAPSTNAIASAMLQASLDAIVVTDQEQVVIEWNPAAERMFGYARSEALGQPLGLLIVPPGERAAQGGGVKWVIAARVARPVRDRVQFGARRRGGEVFPCEVAFHALDFGDQTCFAAHLRDLSEQRRADRERDQLARVAEASTDFIAFSDLDNRLMYINRAGRQLVGYAGDIPVQATLADVVHPGDRERLVQEIWPQVNETGQWQGEMRFVHQGTGETIEVHRTIFAVHDPVTGLNVGFATVSRDIREVKKAEQERLTWQARLESQVAERTRELTDLNEELDAFSYGVSHDLRAPLRHIVGFSQLARRSLEDPQDVKAGLYLQVIEQAAEKMDTLVEALLTLARQGRGPLRLAPLDLRQVAERVRTELEPDVAQRQVQWEVGDLPAVRGDAVLLHQVLSNLLQNAVKYTRTRAVAVITVRAYRQEAEWVVEVQDNGVGFDPAYAGKLFGVFQRLHSEREFEGIGVGLANVQRIVKRHGGRIWASAVLGKGATFSFTLPA